MAPIFTVGEAVRLVGLVSSHSLNGATGTIIGDTNFESRRRYGVRLESPAAAIALHPSGISLSPKNLMKVIKCANFGCDEIGTRGCTACLNEFYCSAECQKTNWKVHKILCRFIKLMPDALLPLNDGFSIISDIIKELKSNIPLHQLGTQKYVRLLYHLAAFAEHQFGKRVPGTSSYSRDVSDSIENWEVEMVTLYTIYVLLAKHEAFEHYGGNVRHYWTNLMPIFLKSVEMLEPWIYQIGLSESERVDVISEKNIDVLLHAILSMERSLVTGYRVLNNLDKAHHYSKQAIFHAKQIRDGEERARDLFDALSSQGTLYYCMGKFIEAKAVREEAYIYVSEIYNPEHPIVLEAGGKLIEILNKTEDYYDAERFARVCYDGLTRPPLDPDSYEAADAAKNLAEASCNLIMKNGPEAADIEEAEMLARKAVRIIKHLQGAGNEELSMSLDTLVNILLLKKDFSNETRILLEEHLSDAITYQGKDGKNAAIAYYNLGRFHFEIGQTLTIKTEMIMNLELSKSFFKESSRLSMKNYGPSYPNKTPIQKNISAISKILLDHPLETV
jgi:tetratricopeptide (TPR) repeat protein